MAKKTLSEWTKKERKQLQQLEEKLFVRIFPDWYRSDLVQLNAKMLLREISLLLKPWLRSIHPPAKSTSNRILFSLPFVVFVRWRNFQSVETNNNSILFGCVYANEVVEIGTAYMDRYSCIHRKVENWEGTCASVRILYFKQKQDENFQNENSFPIISFIFHQPDRSNKFRNHQSIVCTLEYSLIHTRAHMLCVLDLLQ